MLTAREAHPARAPYRSPRPTLVAEAAGTASQLLPCHVCGYAVLPGQRCARLADGTGRWIHVAGCSAKATP